MNRRRFLITGTAIGVPLAARTHDQSEIVYRFSTASYYVRMSVEYFDAYASKGFWFKNQLDNSCFCFSGTGEQNRNCLPNFFGSVAIARYHVRSCCGQANSVALREHVPTIDQDSHLAVRPPFEYAIRVENGIASDIQAFGFHQETSPHSHPVHAPNGPWCFLRQDLYLQQDGSPFLVIHWKHTLNMIRLLDVIPGEHTRLISKPERR